MEELTCPVGS